MLRLKHLRGLRTLHPPSSSSQTVLPRQKLSLETDPTFLLLLPLLLLLLLLAASASVARRPPQLAAGVRAEVLGSSGKGYGVRGSVRAEVFQQLFASASGEVGL
jgi:hypothetical protein